MSRWLPTKAHTREEWDEPDGDGGIQHCVEEETFTMSDFVCNSCDKQDLVEDEYDLELSPDPGIDYNRDGIFCTMLPPMMQESGMGMYSTKATYDFGEGYTLTLTGTVEMEPTTVGGD